MRLVTYNVHGFLTATHKRKFNEIVSFFQQSQADVIVLQEITLGNKTYLSIDTIKQAMKDIGYPHFIISKDVTNAVFSKTEFSCGELDLGTNQNGTYNVPRNALLCIIELKGAKYGIIGTHLDVYDESGEMRKRQMAKILNAVPQLNTDAIIIAGDFNSLRRADYTPDAWERIIRQNCLRKVNTIEDAIPLIENAGFTDSFIKVGQRPPQKTCRYDRRVDYVYVKGIDLVSSIVVQSNDSDHYPLVIETKN
jgi:endonuclease/exonuclease/phosphatase family metal-dependent hydrolase